jgi:hypothetical protein
MAVSTNAAFVVLVKENPKMKHHIAISEPYDNGRGWKTYDWTTQRVERDLTAWVWGIAVVVAMALVVGAIMGYQGAIIGAVTKALVR